MMVGGRRGRSLPARRRGRRASRSSTSTRSQPGDATFTLHRGEILGIAGLLGAGRTRLLRTLFGLEPVRSGRDCARRLHRRRRRPHERWQQGMGMLSEDRKDEGLALGLEHRRQPDAHAAWRRSAPPAPSGPSASARRPRRWIERLAVRCAGPRQAVVGALGRQPAEGRARAAAPSRRRRPRPRRADPRHRRRQQGADLRADRRARRHVRSARRPRPCCSSAAICRSCSASAIASRSCPRPAAAPRSPSPSSTEHDLMVATMTGGAARRMTARPLLDRTRRAPRPRARRARVRRCSSARSSSSPATSS